MFRTWTGAACHSRWGNYWRWPGFLNHCNRSALCVSEYRTEVAQPPATCTRPTSPKDRGAEGQPRKVTTGATRTGTARAGKTVVGPGGDSIPSQPSRPSTSVASAARAKEEATRTGVIPSGGRAAGSSTLAAVTRATAEEHPHAPEEISGAPPPSTAPPIPIRTAPTAGTSEPPRPPATSKGRRAFPSATRTRGRETRQGAEQSTGSPPDYRDALRPGPTPVTRARPPSARGRGREEAAEALRDAITADGPQGSPVAP